MSIYCIVLIDEALETVDKERSDLKIALTNDRDGRSVINITNINELITLTDTLRMVFEDYSLKTKKIRGLRRFSVISVENDCGLCLQDSRYFHGEKCMKFSFEL